MTIKEAIEYWEGLYKTFSSQIEKEENCFGRMHLQTTVDALDIAISALRAQEENPFGGWISVEDELPERFQPVIICREKKRGEYIVEQGMRDVKDWWKVYGTRTKNVLFWMPMPWPPREV